MCSALVPVQQGKETQLLHVFEEDLILGNDDGNQTATESPVTAQSGTLRRTPIGLVHQNASWEIL